MNRARRGTENRISPGRIDRASVRVCGSPEVLGSDTGVYLSYVILIYATVERTVLHLFRRIEHSDRVQKRKTRRGVSELIVERRWDQSRGTRIRGENLNGCA